MITNLFAPSIPDKVVLHFDVNKTIIPYDTSNNSTSEEMLTNLLAENCISDWDDKHTNMSFKDYVYAGLLPGDKSDRELKQMRKKILCNFICWLEENQHPALQSVLSKRNEILQKFTDPITHEINFCVFQSFFNLLRKLKELEVNFTIILRTFGEDLAEVTAEISQHTDGIQFNRFGKFSNKILTLNPGGEIEKIDDIFKTFLESKEHFAIKDNWTEWNKDQERGRSGKPFIYDSTGNWHNISNLSIFFDDNITGEEIDILNPIEVTNKPVIDLLDKVVFKVEPIKAILDDEYYINLVMKAIQFSHNKA